MSAGDHLFVERILISKTSDSRERCEKRVDVASEVVGKNTTNMESHKSKLYLLCRAPFWNKRKI